MSLKVVVRIVVFTSFVKNKENIVLPGIYLVPFEMNELKVDLGFLKAIVSSFYWCKMLVQ